MVDQQNQQEEAKMKLEAAKKNGTSAGILQPKAKLASTMSGASKLLVTSKTGSLGMLRKPTTASSKLLKKKSSTSSKMRINKLSVKLPVNGIGADDDDDKFEDIEQTQKNVKEAAINAKQIAEDEALAKKVQDELIFNGGSMTDVPVTNTLQPPEPTPIQEPVPQETAPIPAIKSVSSKDENIAKLKNMTSDFWSQM
jgi:hypothetical protein